MQLSYQLPLRTICAVLCSASLLAAAHDFKAGDIVIDHPYALPSPPGSTTGAMHLRALKNTGEQADQLVAARTPVAASVEIHRMQMDAQDVMRMRAVDAVPLPPKTTVSLKHGGEWHLMLLNLKAPLKEGDRFPATLRFACGGEREVRVWVQQPRNGQSVPEHAH